jgi:predicted XRE-type DNA-binding protein
MDEVRTLEKVKLTRSSGNVFRDLGFSGDEAEYLKLRAELMVNLQKVITARGLKQAEAAAHLGVAQPRMNDLMRGRIDLFSIDTLIEIGPLRDPREAGAAPSSPTCRGRLAAIAVSSILIGRPRHRAWLRPLQGGTVPVLLFGLVGPAMIMGMGGTEGAPIGRPAES